MVSRNYGEIIFSTYELKVARERLRIYIDALIFVSKVRILFETIWDGIPECHLRIGVNKHEEATNIININ